MEYLIFNCPFVEIILSHNTLKVTQIVNDYGSEKAGEFGGLTDGRIQKLMYSAFGDESPMAYKPFVTNATLQRIPFFRLVQNFLEILHASSGIRLNKDKTLTTDSVLQLVKNASFPSSVLGANPKSIQEESDSEVLEAMRECTVLSGVTVVYNHSLMLSDEGKELLLPENCFQLFQRIFRTHYRVYNFDKTVPPGADPFFKMAFPFFLYLVAIFGSKYRPIKFYLTHLLNAYPGMYSPTLAYRVKTSFIDALLKIYGFIEPLPKQDPLRVEDEDYAFRTTDLLFDVIKLRKLPEQLN